MEDGNGRSCPARLRRELVEAVANGLRPTIAATIAGVSRVTIWRWVVTERRARQLPNGTGGASSGQ